MQAPIVQSSEPVTLVGGGPVGATDFDTALKHAPLLVAADGGAGHALRAGHDPVAVIGDLDSLKPKDRARIPADRLFLIREQETIDFDKALRHFAAPLVLAIGFLGGRVDLQLAAFNTLLRHKERRVVLLGENEIVFHAPPVVELALQGGEIVSLFPMRPLSGARSVGLEWPIDGLHMAPDGRVGISNRALGPVRIEPGGDGLLAVLPRAALAAVMLALVPV